MKSLFCLVANIQKDQSLLTPYFSWADREHSQNLSFTTGRQILALKNQSVLFFHF